MNEWVIKKLLRLCDKIAAQNYVKNCWPEIHYFDIRKVQPAAGDAN